MVIKDSELTISVEEAARRLHIGRSLAYQMAKDGRLPTICWGRRRMVSLPALKKMISNVGQQQTSEVN